MKKIIIQKREFIKKKPIDESLLQTNQRNAINQLFLDEDFEGKVEIKRELNKKLNSYKMQDIKKKRYVSDLFISLFDLIEKLVVSKLKCYYCKCNIVLLYNYSPFQFGFRFSEKARGPSLASSELKTAPETHDPSR